MTEQIETEVKLGPIFQVFPEYGVYEIPSQNGQEKVVIVSQPSWERFFQDIKGRDFGHAVVLSPELITVAGKNFKGMSEYCDEVASDLEQVRQISLVYPETSYIIGSPDFNSTDRPFNAAFVFHDGEVQIIHKRLPAAGDVNFFQFDPKDEPLSIGQQGILICSDLLGVAIPYSAALTLQAQVASGSREFALQILNTRFVDKNINSLLVLTCWGIGGKVSAINGRTRGNMTQEGINAYYLSTLKWACEKTLSANSNLKRIIVCDIAFSKDEIEMFKQRGELVASKPMSLVASR